MDAASTFRDIARLVLVGGLLVLLVTGLIWAFNPSEDGGVRFSGEGTDPGDTAAADDGREEEGGATEAEPEPTEEPTAEPTETGPSAEELIADAPEPSSTSVQVLDSGGGSSRTQAAASALRELGYNVVNITSSRANVARTTVWFTEGQEDAALGLRARDERVIAVEPNEGLSSGVNLHLLVGSDWTAD